MNIGDGLIMSGYFFRKSKFWYLAADRSSSQLGSGWFLDLTEVCFVKTGWGCFSKHFVQHLLMIVINYWYKIIVHETVFSITNLSVSQRVVFDPQVQFILFAFSTWLGCVLSNRTLVEVIFGVTLPIFFTFVTFLAKMMIGLSGMNGTISGDLGMIGRLFEVDGTGLVILKLLDEHVSFFVLRNSLLTIFHLEKLCFYLIYISNMLNRLSYPTKNLLLIHSFYSQQHRNMLKIGYSIESSLSRLKSRVICWRIHMCTNLKENL